MKFLRLMRTLSPEDFLVIRIGYLLLSDVAVAGMKIKDSVFIEDTGSKRLYTFEIRIPREVSFPVQALRARLAFLAGLLPYSIYSISLHVEKCSLLWEDSVGTFSQYYLTLVSDAHDI